MHEKILLVDDEPHVTDAFKRHMHHAFPVETAQEAATALELLHTRGPFAVVVSDLRMPGLDGIRFLSRVKEQTPDTVRIMLTGHADLHTAIEAINEGHIFRFLTKPCSPDMLAKVIRAGVEQYRLIVAEREILEKTLHGSVKVLADMLALVNPTAFGRATRIRRLAQMLMRRLKVEPAWPVDMAVMLSQIGCVTVPEEVLRKVCRAEALTPDEQRMVDAHPRVGHDLIATIPRLEPVAEIIAYQEKRYDGAGLPHDDRRDERIPMGARMLKVALDFDALEARGMSHAQALDALQRRPGWYDPTVLAALQDALTVLEAGDQFTLRDVSAGELKVGMLLAEDVVTNRDLLIISKGQEVTVPIILRLRNFVSNAAVREPIKVLIPRGGG